MKTKNIIHKIFFLTTIAGLCCVVTKAPGQLTTQGKNEAAVELSYSKTADLSKSAVALVTAKNAEGKFVPAKNAKVNFYVLQNKKQLFLTGATTDNTGKATISILKELPLDDSLYFTIVAKIENDSLYENAQEQIHYKDASLTLTLNPKDTARLVTAKVTEKNKGGKETAVKGAEVKFYIKRLFGIMPASEDNDIATDEKGEASFAIPKSIPGDTAGVVTIAVRMEDNKEFGNIDAKATESWGAVLAVEKNPFPRALWEPYAPMPLVITISMLFGGVWVIYFFIFSQLRKIKKEGQIINNSTP